ncbi:hypothetical protein [Oricola sp.]|uniref:hypothetical protein n=1 Tax=Oricola sp. TaxID=1979950 RepID=UPI0025CC3D8D|nr:hypothetical protein [Oricola sp.]MCI5075837.1 hypothetical protein [Oricola sp.]
MRFTLILVGTALAAGSLGGAASHLHATGKLGSVDVVIDGAKGKLRDTMRDFDGNYYERGADYATCAQAFGSRAVGYLSNSEVTFSCECFDKQMAGIGGVDRKTAIKALGPGPDATPAAARDVNYHITAVAKRILNKCDIVPWPEKPALLRHPI